MVKWEDREDVKEKKAKKQEFLEELARLAPHLELKDNRVVRRDS